RLTVPKRHGSPGGIYSPSRDQSAIRRDGQVEGLLDIIVPGGDRARPLADNLADIGDRLSGGRGEGGAAAQDGQDRSQESEGPLVPHRSHPASLLLLRQINESSPRRPPPHYRRHRGVLQSRAGPSAFFLRRNRIACSASARGGILDPAASTTWPPLTGFAE